MLERKVAHGKCHRHKGGSGAWMLVNLPNMNQKSKMRYYIHLNCYRISRYSNTDAKDHVRFFQHSEDQQHTRARSLETNG